jgi:hypothetical protein
MDKKEYMREYMRAWREKNREKYTNYSKKYREEKAEYLKACRKKRYAEADKEVLKAYYRNLREKNKTYGDYQREYQRKYQRELREKRRAQNGGRLTFPKAVQKQYKVFHTDKPWMKKGEKKEVEVVDAYNQGEAISKVQEMYPNHRVGKAVLLPQ